MVGIFLSCKKETKDKGKEHWCINIQVQFIPSVSLIIQFSSVSSLKSVFFFFLSFPVFYSGSFNCHGLNHATPEASLAHISHDLSLSILKHPNNLGEGRTHFRVGVPAAGHYVTQHRQTFIWDNWPYPLVHHSKCSLHSCHVLEGKRTCYELPENDSKAIHIHLLCVRPMLNHLSAWMGKLKT